VVYFVVFCIFCGHLVYFSRFGMLYKENSGNPAFNRHFEYADLPESKLSIRRKNLAAKFQASTTRNVQLFFVSLVSANEIHFLKSHCNAGPAMIKWICQSQLQGDRIGQTLAQWVIDFCFCSTRISDTVPRRHSRSSIGLKYVPMVDYILWAVTWKLQK
jgi:hypothetical protein